MSGVFRNIDPPPPHRPEGVHPPPPPLVRGEDTLAGWKGGGGSIVRKTPDTALYSKVQTNQFSKITSSAGIICTSGKVYCYCSSPPPKSVRVPPLFRPWTLPPPGSWCCPTLPTPWHQRTQCCPDHPVAFPVKRELTVVTATVFDTAIFDQRQKQPVLMNSNIEYQILNLRSASRLNLINFFILSATEEKIRIRIRNQRQCCGSAPF